MTLLVLVAAALAGLAAAAFFAAWEGAFLAVASRPEPPRPADGEAPSRVARLLARADRLQHGIALGHLLAVVWTAAVAWLATRSALGAPAGWPGWVAIVLGAGFVLLVAGEMAPKALAHEHPGAWARRAALPLEIWQRALAPLVALIGALTRAVEGAVGPGPGAEPLTSEDVRSIFADTTARADLDLVQRQMITSIFAFGDTTVREVMTPRPDIFAIEETAPWSEAVESVRQAEYSRVPLYRESLDGIVGVIYAKDLLAGAHGRTEPPDRLWDLAREARFVPEATKIDDLLRRFQRERIHLAVVVDEYGGTAGIVTLEDILEELVGEIQDEYDREEPLVEPLADGSLRLDGRLDADDFNELTGSGLESEGVETMGGIVARELGRIPEDGDRVDIDGWRFVVEAVDDRRVVKVRAARIREEPPDGGSVEEASP